MTLKLHFSSLSMGASVDQQTGSLSVFDIIEEIRTPTLPIQLQNLVISLALEKDEPKRVDGKLFIHLLTPDGNQNVVGSGDMTMPAEQKRMKAVFRLGGFPVTQYGAHRFVLSWLNGEGVKEGEAILDFEAVKVNAPQQPAPSGSTPLAH